MNPTLIQELPLFRDFLSQESEIGIVIGGQNLDSYAASLALFLALSASGKRIQIISKRQPTVEVSSLVGIDKVRESFNTSSGDTSKLVVALPYIKGEVEKVLFTETPNTINFHLTAAAGRTITPFDLSQVKLMWGEGGIGPTAIIAIGVDTLDELAGISNSQIVNIDKSPTNQKYGDVVLVDPNFSSISEIVAKLIKELNLPAEIDAAQNILDGVLFATRNLTKPNTSPLAFEAVSTAMYMGAQRKTEEIRRDEQPRRDIQATRQDDGRRDDFRREERFDRNDNNQRQQFQDRGRDRNQDRNQGRQRVQDNDFPAMHMQGRNQSQDRRDRNQQPRNPQQQMPSRPQQTQQQAFGQDRQNRAQGQKPFGSNPNDIEELMRKIKEENARRNPQNRPQRNPQDFSRREEPEEQQAPIQDAQIVDDQVPEPQMSAPIEDAQIPQDQGYNPPASEDVPDDWLMPKVFKSSKNNN